MICPRFCLTRDHRQWRRQRFGNTITFPGITVPADGSVTRSFQVVVKILYTNLSYTMSNTYGNTVNITINTRRFWARLLPRKLARTRTPLCLPDL